MSTETKWTPGPWRHWKEEPGYCGEMVAANGKSVCVFLDDPNDKDASLMETATELYEALNGMMVLSLQLAVNSSLPAAASIETEPYVIAARAAIKKARGE